MEAIGSWGGKTINRLVILHDGDIFSYSLHALGQMALGKGDAKVLLASKENISGHESNVVFSKVTYVGQRVIRKSFKKFDLIVRRASLCS